MRRWMAICLLAAVAGAGPVRARSHGHHDHRGLHALNRPGPTEAEVRAALEALRSSDARLCTLAVDRLAQGGWDSGRQRLAGEEVLPVPGRGPAKAPEVIGVLGDTLADPRPCVRRAAAVWLGDSPTPEAQGKLVTALRSASPATREAAAYGLGVHGDGAGREDLVAALRDGAPPVAVAAAWALGRSADPRNTPAL